MQGSISVQSHEAVSLPGWKQLSSTLGHTEVKADLRPTVCQLLPMLQGQAQNRFLQSGSYAGMQSWLVGAHLTGAVWG